MRKVPPPRPIWSMGTHGFLFCHGDPVHCQRTSQSFSLVTSSSPGLASSLTQKIKNEKESLYSWGWADCAKKLMPTQIQKYINVVLKGIVLLISKYLSEAAALIVPSCLRLTSTCM